MLNHVARLALAAAIVVLLAPGVDAQSQKIHPRCAKVKDKVKCTCFFENGGHVVERPDGSKRGQIWSDSDGEGFVRCMHRNGRSNG